MGVLYHPHPGVLRMDYEQTYIDEFFARDPAPTSYRLVDLRGEAVKLIFYEPELQHY